jgi:hypothetical protein
MIAIDEPGNRLELGVNSLDGRRRGIFDELFDFLDRRKGFPHSIVGIFGGIGQPSVSICTSYSRMVFPDRCQSIVSRGTDRRV